MTTIWTWPWSPDLLPETQFPQSNSRFLNIKDYCLYHYFLHDCGNRVNYKYYLLCICIFFVIHKWYSLASRYFRKDNQEILLPVFSYLLLLIFSVIIYCIIRDGTFAGSDIILIFAFVLHLNMVNASSSFLVTFSTIFPYLAEVSSSGSFLKKASWG